MAYLKEEIGRKIGFALMGLGVLCSVFWIGHYGFVQAPPQSGVNIQNSPINGNCNAQGASYNVCSPTFGPKSRALDPEQTLTIAAKLRGFRLPVLVTETNPRNPEIISYANDIVSALRSGGIKVEIFDSVRSFGAATYGLELRPNGHNATALVQAFSSAKINLPIGEDPDVQVPSSIRDRYTDYIGISVGEREP